MLEKALTGSRSYKSWVVFLLIVFGIGFLNYLRQLNFGLGITGMSRDVSWGLYIGQFTFLVGVAASAVMLVLPYYLHNYKVFGKITILGEFLAVASVTMCLSFIVADLGQPARAFNVLLYPTPNSVLFWDMVVLNGYLFLNIVIGWAVLGAEQEIGASSKVGKISDIRVHSLGHQHSHGDSVSVRGSTWEGLLAHRDHGAPIPWFRVCIRSFSVDSYLSFSEKVHEVRCRLGSHSNPGEDRHLRDDHQRVFLPVRTLYRVLQPDTRAHEPFHVSLHGSARARVEPYALDVGNCGVGPGGCSTPDKPEDAEQRNVSAHCLHLRFCRSVDREGSAAGRDRFYPFTAGNFDPVQFPHCLRCR